MRNDVGEATYRLDWQEVRHDWPAWIVLLGSFIAGVLLYPSLPEQVPIHWNIAGQVDGYGSRAAGAFMLPALNLGIYCLMLFLPLVDPNRANYARFLGFYRGFRVLMTLFLAVLYAITLLAVEGLQVDVGLVVTLGLSLLFLYLGNSLGRVRHNYFVGIKTPWTLANEEVWRRTHRLGGRLFVLVAVLPWIAWPFSRTAAFIVLIGGLVLVSAATVVYSAVLYHRIAGR
ncbi:SdpI family protein [Limnochorda pilosa]|uniref:DUF1648 domain-containing protein n=1 Tax=Limnochorda pilosa TaxID=1555112 RepID=A0A0K2SFP2_LIMPI|nr:DUF1648 domain-containing protein [Limnochorda pilosa]BAS25910.1 hypothetical protein LIP_0053 [Limnochorda pilosa]